MASPSSPARRAAGELRDDVPPAELASYCLHALTAASSLTSHAAIRRLVSIAISGMRPVTAGEPA